MYENQQKNYIMSFEWIYFWRMNAVASDGIV